LFQKQLENIFRLFIIHDILTSLLSLTYILQNFQKRS